MSEIQLKAMWWALLDLLDRVVNSRAVTVVYEPIARVMTVPLVVSFGMIGVLDQSVREWETRRRQARQSVDKL